MDYESVLADFQSWPPSVRSQFLSEATEFHTQTMSQITQRIVTKWVNAHEAIVLEYPHQCELYDVYVRESDGVMRNIGNISTLYGESAVAAAELETFNCDHMEEAVGTIQVVGIDVERFIRFVANTPLQRALTSKIFVLSRLFNIANMSLAVNFIEFDVRAGKVYDICPSCSWVVAEGTEGVLNRRNAFADSDYESTRPVHISTEILLETPQTKEYWIDTLHRSPFSCIDSIKERCLAECDDEDTFEYFDMRNCTIKLLAAEA